MLFEISEPNQSANPHEKTYAIGIDLGTTHSLVSCIRNGAADILTDENNHNLIPSAVYIDKDKIIVGNEAINILESKNIDKSQYVFTSFKRFMGKNIQDFENENLKYIIDKNSNHTINFKTQNNTVINPIQLSAHVLSYLKNIAEKTMTGKLIGAVITVPAYFNDAQRQATKDAARLAGLEVLRLINEPTAAALAYGLDNNSQGYFAVYDLGGGTFDISILNVQEDVFEVVATAGNTALGGDDFDEIIAEYILNKLNIGVKNISNLEFHNLKNTAKNIKHNLTYVYEVKLDVEINHISYNFIINQDEFAQLSQALIQKTIDLLNSALKDAKIDAEELNGIVLVGGSTRMPCVQNALNNILPHKILTNLNPDEVVALGAARQAHALTKGSDEWLLLDVVPLSLGIETMGGLAEKIIERNSTIPIAKAQEFTTYADGQTAMKLHIVQGEREKAADCRSLASIILQDIPPMTAGMAKVRITFSIDASGMLTISANEQISGRNTQIEIEPSYGLTEEQILDMLKQSFVNAQMDIEHRLLIEEEVNANQLIYACEQALLKDASLLKNEEILLLNQHIQQLKLSIEQTKQSNDSDFLKKANEKFSNATQFFADIRMNKAIMQAIAGKDINTL